MLELKIDADGLGQVAKDLAGTPQQVERALRSTLGKMAAWLRVRSIRGLSANLHITQKVVRRRLKTLRVQKTADGQSVRVWYGLDDIAMIYLGARQNSSGVKAGTRSVKSAFIANGKNGGKQVFKRKGSDRLPIEKQTLEVRDKAQAYIEDKLLGTAAFDAQFMKTFEHEMQWQTRTRK